MCTVCTGGSNVGEKKIIIIGGGIAGLCAGCYLRMNGYDTVIYELHSVPGGLCAAWKRKGYTFDACVHWLVGSSTGNNFYKLWDELIDMSSLEIVDQEEFLRVEDKEGNALRVFTDVNMLEEEMKRVAPEDKKLIEDFTGAIRKFTKMPLPVDKAPELYNFFDGLGFFFKLMPYMGIFRKWSKLTNRNFADMCKNPLLRKAILSMFLPDSSIVFIIFTLAWMHQRQAGYPVGGSLNFARLIERKYIELGGEIRYNSRVKRIIVENDKARGIMLDSGESFNADFVISAADGHYTIYNMLEGKYVDEKIAGYYENMKIFPSLVYVSLGISRTFENEPQQIIFPVEKPILIDESKSHEDMVIRIFNYDPTLAQKGKTCLTTMFETQNYEYWTDLRENDRKKYKEEKDRIAKEVIDALEKRFGNIKSHVEVYDVATPATFIRYTNNWKGSFEGWLPTADMFTSRMKRELPGLKNFYMIGQWVEPGGGLPTALRSGRNAAQVICRRDKKKFTVRNGRGKTG